MKNIISSSIRYVTNVGIEVKLLSNRMVQVSINRNKQIYNSWCLGIIDVFSRPRLYQEAVDSLLPKMRSHQNFLECTNVISDFIQKGILIEENAPSNLTATPFNAGFDNANMHISMLNDVQRTRQYIEAIQKTIVPGDIVVEIGTGTGVLAMAAAKAGASKVYAIEAGKRMGQIAKANFRANQLADKITLIEGWSTQVTIPEKANVLISEIIGNHPLDEGVLEYTKDAQKRFLVPDARMIPQQLAIMARPVTVPDKIWEKHNFTPSSVANWEALYGMKFTGVLASKNGLSLFKSKVNLKANKVANFQNLSLPHLLTAIDLSAIPSNLNSQHTIMATHTGILNGMIIYCEANLTEQVVLSTNPMEADENISWGTFVQLLEKPISLGAGEKIRFTYDLTKGIRQIKLIN